MQLKRLLIIVQEPVLVFVHPVKTDVKENVKVVKAVVRMDAKQHVLMDVTKHVRQDAGTVVRIHA